MAVSMKRGPLQLPNKWLLIWLGILGLGLVIGLYSAIQIFIHGLILTNMSDSVPWGLWIAAYVALIGASAGLFGVLVAAAMIAPLARVQLLFPPIEMTMRQMAWLYLGIAAA